MNEKERQHTNKNESPPAGSGGDEADTDANALDAARERRAAADKAIDKILSGNSEAYVAQSVQHGGQ